MMKPFLVVNSVKSTKLINMFLFSCNVFFLVFCFIVVDHIILTIIKVHGKVSIL